MQSRIATLVLAVCGCVLATAAIAQVTENRLVATFTAPAARAGASIDYANAKPMPIPLAQIPPDSQPSVTPVAPHPMMLFCDPRVSRASIGNGEENPIQLAPPRQLSQQGLLQPREFGTQNLPYTTSRVNARDHVVLTAAHCVIKYGTNVAFFPRTTCPPTVREPRHTADGR
jgi:hypothetical protein